MRRRNDPSRNHLDSLLSEIRALIQNARDQVARTANAGLTIAYWHIGKRILAENLTDGRGDYGQKILATLLQELTWSHFSLLLPLKDPLAREFYAEICRVERVLRIGLMEEHLALCREEKIPVPFSNPNPVVTIRNSYKDSVSPALREV